MFNNFLQTIPEILSIFVIYIIVIFLFFSKEAKADLRLFLAKTITKFFSTGIMLFWFLACPIYFSSKLELNSWIVGLIFILGLLLLIPIDYALYSAGKSTFRLNTEQAVALRETLTGIKHFEGRENNESK